MFERTSFRRYRETAGDAAVTAWRQGVPFPLRTQSEILDIIPGLLRVAPGMYQMSEADA